MARECGYQSCPPQVGYPMSCLFSQGRRRSTFSFHTKTFKPPYVAMTDP